MTTVKPFDVPSITSFVVDHRKTQQQQAMFLEVLQNKQILIYYRYYKIQHDKDNFHCSLIHYC